MTEQSQARLLAATLLGSDPLAPDFMLATMSCPDLARMLEPGQFFNIAVPGSDAELLRLPFAYADADPREGMVSFGYRVVGEGTRRLATLPPGTRTDLLGPLGHGWRFPEGVKTALVVGGGSGVAPIVPLVKRLGELGVATDVVEGAQTSRAIVFENEILARGARSFNVSTDDGTRGTHGFAAVLTERLMSENRYDAVYICGPKVMMRGIADQAAQRGIACQVSMETGMMCGFGACATCPIETTQGMRSVCKDGPVFDALEVIW